MSAFVVTNNHINSILRAFNYYASSWEVIETPQGDFKPNKSLDLQKMAEILLAENVRSVNHRYQERAKYGAITFVRSGNVLSPVETIKACDCYSYQSCETKDYAKSAANLIIEGIRGVVWHKLPGYDEAPWAIE